MHPPTTLADIHPITAENGWKFMLPSQKKIIKFNKNWLKICHILNCGTYLLTFCRLLFEVSIPCNLREKQG